MKVIEELPLGHKRQLRHTLVLGGDEKHYKIYTFQLYDTEPPAEFPNFEVNVQECDPDGTFKVLVQPFMKRFFKKGLAIDLHQQLLDNFDEMVKIDVVKTKR